MAKWKANLKSEAKFFAHLVAVAAVLYGTSLLLGVDVYDVAAASALAIAVRLDMEQENPDG